MSLSARKKTLELRARILKTMRAFFDARGYMEVETPVRVETPAMEEHIDAEASGDHWLRTSPELHMKRMVCAGYERIYQIGPCFRRGESGARHRPEYTMLEWYRAGATYRDLEIETHELLRAVCETAGQTEFMGVDLSAEPVRYTVRDAFWLWAGWDPVEAFDEDRFDLDLVEKVEPRLAEFPVPVILTDFPAARAALARLKEGAEGAAPVAERWELYLAGMELANAYTELTDAAEQRARFEACGRARAERGQEVYPLDEEFLTALEKGMPACAGIALGVDRLMMILAETGSIMDVRSF
ncbi:MAG: EF-P lysine aminoacylase GenX [Verrucomicrobia bacterium]|nr:EF-P lysine aminoacylase GenX [Verrucomicrobiota bacterium]MCH8527226.1 EF-P lysine aminoacylase GenX [Kiritimatiellia bacterium]